MTIAIYPGSFNPLHIGHLAIAKYLLKQQNIDQVRLMVSPQNPLKEKVAQEEAFRRLRATCEAVERANLGPRLVVSDREFTLPPPHYTINTLKTVQEEEPQNSFLLVVGADNLAIIEEWYNWEELLATFPLLVYPRSGHKLDQLAKKYGVTTLSAPLIEISSSKIRAAEKLGLNMSHFKI